MCCPNSFWRAWIEPGELNLEFGSTGSVHGREQGRTCYGAPVPAYYMGDTWTVDNPVLLAVSGSGSEANVDAVGAGTANVLGSWEVYEFERVYNYEQGYQECVFYKSVVQPSSTVFVPQIFLKNAKVYDLTATFEGLSQFDQTATIKAGSSNHANEICGSDPQEFTLIISFKLPPGGELVPSRCTATPDGVPDHDYRIGTPTCVMDDSFSNTGRMSITARRRCCPANDAHPGIRFVIGGNRTGQSGNIDTPGRINILCAQ